MAKFSYFKGIFIAILVAVGGWTLFSVVRLLAQRFLENMGIFNEITQHLIILGGIILILVLLGFGFKNSIKKLTK